MNNEMMTSHADEGFFVMFFSHSLPFLVKTMLRKGAKNCAIFICLFD